MAVPPMRDGWNGNLWIALLHAQISKLTRSISPSICFLLKGYELGRGIWGSLIFLKYTCSDCGRVERCDELQEKVSKTAAERQRFLGSFWHHFLMFLPEDCMHFFFVMPILIIFTGAYVKQVSD